MKRVYTAGRRFDRLRNASLLICEVLVFVFYFIYGLTFKDLIPALMGAPLIILFIVIAVAVWRGVEWVWDRTKANVRYEVCPDALEIGTGKTLQRFPYTSFQKVEFNGFRYRDILPVIFYIDGKKLTLNQYVDDIYELTHQILIRLDPSVPVDPKLIERVDIFREIKK